MTAASAGLPTTAIQPRRAIIARQAAFDLRLLLRNGEQILLTILIPVVLLIGLGRTSVVSVGDYDAPRIDIVVPGIIALAVMSTAFTSLAISTGFDRRAGVLKFLGATPLLRSGLVWSRILAVLGMVAIQLAVLLPLALLLGWNPAGPMLSALVLVVAGVAAFGSLGVALAGVMRAEATLAAANGIYLLLLLAGGVVIPLSVMPAPLALVASLLPSGALGEGLRLVLVEGSAMPWPQLVVLLVWALVGSVAASRTFRWE
jgi:ABC-2 type transport system permease protein